MAEEKKHMSNSAMNGVPQFNGAPPAGSTQGGSPKVAPGSSGAPAIKNYSIDKNAPRRFPGGGRGPRGGPPGMVAEKAKDFKGSLKRLLNYLKPHTPRLIIVALLSVFSTIFMIVGPKIMAKATDALAQGIQKMMLGIGSIDFSIIGNILLKCLVLYVISSVFQYLQTFIMAGLTEQITYDMRGEINHKINLLPLSYFHGTSQGDVLSRITNDVDNISMNLNSCVTQVISSIATFVGVLVMMFSINVPMTFIALTIIPLSLFGMKFIVKRSQKYFIRNQRNLGDVNGHIEEMFGAHLVVKAFNGEEHSMELFSVGNDMLFESGWKSQFLSSLMHPLMTLIGNLGYIVVCIVGAIFTSSGSMTIGGIQAFIQYTRNMNRPITQVSQMSNQVQQTVASAERVFELLDETEENRPTPKYSFNSKIGESEVVDITGEVNFKNVRFGYNPDKIIIKDFTADIKPGQKVAIVGPTGAGKTTLVKLIMHFHELNGGAIYIDGRNIDDFDRTNLRSELGMVLQDTWLFGGTIMENIRYGKPDATDEEVIEAAKAAQVDKFVRTIPEGYDMVLNEEATNISQGQKQLMTIARAFLEDAQILILDEATSSVDTRTEILIQKAMNNLMNGRTSFVIAHRLSTIRNADIIFCINNGDIVEQGTHDELMAMNGFYANLYNSQFEDFSA